MDYVFSIIGCLVEPICGKFKEEATYICNYKTSIRTLEAELPNLETRKADIKAIVEVDERRGRVIVQSVNIWLIDVEKLLQDCRQDVLVEDEGWKLSVWQVPNFMYWYSQGKKAQEMIEGVRRLNEQRLDIISLEAPPPSLSSLFSETEERFQSRWLIMNKIIDALKDRDVQRIVVCGMGGVGKTTMVKKLIKYVEQDKLFDRVVMAVVSQNPEPRYIQGEIADSLKFRFNSETVEGRKRELHEVTGKIEKLLVVLDDVWSELNLDKLGLPFENRKILITSRSDVVCRPGRTGKSFTVSPLSPDESWNLFKQEAGDVVDRPHIGAIAKEISVECGCLPLAIVTVAKALGAREQKFVWENALEKLRSSSASSFAEMNECVFSRIQLSYDFLQDEDMKSCFLLCSLFPEDFDIPIELLLRYGVGMGYFRNFDTILKSRKHVHSLVLDLKRCHLLLESDKTECVKMHDVVLHTAKFIAQRDRKFISTTSGWPEEDKLTSCTALALSNLNTTETYPTYVDCSQLKLLHITPIIIGSELIQDSLFRSIGQVMVLALQNFSFVPSLPFQELQNVRTLRLEECKLGEVSIIGILMKRLEILSFRSSEIEELPREIGELTKLRLLDLTGCTALKRIPFGVLSSLSRLEELYLEDVSFRWHEGLEGNASLNELKSISQRLKVLRMRLTSLPKDLDFGCIESFEVDIGSYLYRRRCFPQFYSFIHFGPNLLLLHDLNKHDVMNSLALQQFLKKSEVLKLNEVSHLKKVVNELDDVGFQALIDLSIENCEDVEYVLDESSCQTGALRLLKSLSLKYLPNLKEIVCTDDGNGELTPSGEWQSFGSLTSLYLIECTMLNSIFSPLLSERMTRLESLVVESCHSIEFIHSGISGTEHIRLPLEDIEFTYLTQLELVCLPNLIGFAQSTTEVRMPNSFQSPSNPEDSQLPSLSISQAAEPSATTHGKLFTSTWLHCLPNLEILKIDRCSSIDTVFDFNGSSVDMEIQQAATLMTRVKTIELKEMLRLKHVWSGNLPRGFQGFQNLTMLHVSGCDLLAYIFPASIVPLLSKLQSLEVLGCENLETIVADGLEEAAIIHFPQLNKMCLSGLPKLVAVCADHNKLLLPSLTGLTICRCHLLEKIPFECHSIARPTDEINYIQSSSSDNVKSKEEVSMTEVYSRVSSKSHIIGECPGLNIAVDDNDSLDVMFSNLENLHLYGLPRLKQIWSIGSWAPKGLQNLTSLSINECHLLQFVFPPIEKLISLERLSIRSCRLLKRVVHLEGKVERTVSAFPRLRRLDLYNLATFVPLYQQAHALNWYCLEEVDIGYLSGFNAFSSSSLVEDTLKTDVRPFSDKDCTSSVIDPMEATAKTSAKCIPFVSIEMLPHMRKLSLGNVDEVEVVFELESLRHPNGIFSCLEEMELESLPRLKCIWKTGPQEVRGFNKLEYLQLFRCDSLRSLMSSSISKLLIHLKKLIVNQCSKLEVVVENGEESTSIISFPQLRTVKLENLTSLVSFCRSPCNLQLREMQDFAVSECPGFVADTELSQLEGYKRTEMKSIPYKSIQMLQGIPFAQLATRKQTFQQPRILRRSWEEPES